MSGGRSTCVSSSPAHRAGEPVLRRGVAGSLNSAWTSLGFFTGKDIAFAMFSSVPFGPDRRILGWMKHGGGEKLMKELAAKYNMEAMLCG